MMQEMMANTNFLAVLVCGIASLAVGFVWYGPLFSKRWAALTGWTEEKIKALPSNNLAINYGLTFVGAMFTAFVLAQVLRATGATDVTSGIVVAVVCWAGFIAVGEGTQYLFERRPLELYGISQGYQLVCMVVYAIILMLWK